MPDEFTPCEPTEIRRVVPARRALGFACLVPIGALASPFPAEINLGDLDPANGGDGSVGVFLSGRTGSDQKGYSVAGAGDIDGDGLAELLVGAPGGSGVCSRCASYVVFGRVDFPASVDLLRDPLNSHGADAFIFRSLTPGDAGGHAVTGIGDLNADGFDDFLVGAPSASPHDALLAGEAYVVFGRPTGFLAIFDAEDLLPANGGDGSEGFVVRGVARNDSTGWSVSGGCDVNADGIDDLLLGAPSEGPGAELPGKAYVLFGRRSGYPAEFMLVRLLPANGGDGSEGVVIKGVDGGDFTGDSVACAADANGDGVDDILIGASFADPNDVSRAGEVYLLFGRDGGFGPTFSLATLLPANGGDGSAGVVLLGVREHDETGHSVAPAGDVNADGIADVVVAAPFAYYNGQKAGRAFVVFGRANGFPATLELAGLMPANGGDGSEGFVLDGDAGDSVGYVAMSMAGAADVNGDGISDLILGAPFADAAGYRHGAAYVVFGRAGGFPAMFPLPRLLAENGGDGTRGFVLLGARSSDRAGWGVGNAGDVNGDGVDDLLVGAPFISDDGFADAGNAYVVFGRPAGSPRKRAEVN